MEVSSTVHLYGMLHHIIMHCVCVPSFNVSMVSSLWIFFVQLNAITKSRLGEKSYSGAPSGPSPDIDPTARGIA